MSEERNGFIETRLITEEEVPDITSKRKVLAYHAKSTYPCKTNWIKKTGSSNKVVLFDYIQKEEPLNVTSLESLFKLVFVDRQTKKEFPVNYKDWNFLLEENKVDTRIPVNAVVENGIVKVLPGEGYTKEDLVHRLVKGFASPQEALTTILNYGFDLKRAG